MIKAIIFDLDGVLVDADKLHFDALNSALEWNKQPPISWQEHLTIYKGLPTIKKLEILSERRDLPKDLHGSIEFQKQAATTSLIERLIFPEPEKVEMLELLKRKYKIAVCSNAIKDSVHKMLQSSGLLYLVDFYVSPEDNLTPKPSPHMYQWAIDACCAQPYECLIVEDSDVGYQAAVASEAHVCKVSGPEEVNYYRVFKSILEAERPNVVIPAAGQGKRFAEVGFSYPKPFIPIDEWPMISWVLNNFKTVGGRNILLMQKQHIDKYCIKDILKYEDLPAEIVPVESLTQGAACTVLLARDLINNDNELIIANSDQFLEMPVYIGLFVDYMRYLAADGGIMTFKSDDPKWSYARCEQGNLVTEVAEKNPISDQATVGIYYYKHGKDFVKYAERMISKNIRTNGEFYVCPVFNEFIQAGKRVHTYRIDQEIMHGLGTPEDLKLFLRNKGYESLLPA